MDGGSFLFQELSSSLLAIEKRDNPFNGDSFSLQPLKRLPLAQTLGDDIVDEIVFAIAMMLLTDQVGV